MWALIKAVFFTILGVVIAGSVLGTIYFLSIFGGVALIIGFLIILLFEYFRKEPDKGE